MQEASVSSFGESQNSAVPLINFQLDNVPISKKSQFQFGKQVAEQILAYINGGSSSYFWVRNQRWKTNRNYANGKVNMGKFQDLLGFNAKINHLNLSFQPILTPNRIISGLVGRWMRKNEKIQVSAIDTLSTKEKQEQYEKLEFYLYNKAQLEKIQKESGVQMIPENQFIPSNQEELNLWQAQFQRLPEEILYELGCNDVLGSCGWYDVLKEKMLHDSAAVCFVGTYTWMDSEGIIHVEYLKPENCFYSYSEYPDFRDTTWRGYMRTMKISEVRKKYGKQFNPDNPNALTEEELFELAKTGQDYRKYDNITWQTEWNVSFLRPYDETGIDVMEFEVRTVDSEYYTVTTTRKNKSTIISKGVPKRIGDNDSVVDDSKINIYRGVFTITKQRMLEWGLKKNMIRPQDPKEIGNAEFSYSFYMAQNYDMTCIGIPEKIQEPADQMILARLKIQQLVAKMRPAGTAINWRAVQNIDYGLGDQNKAIDFKKLFDQTGDFYYRDKDAEGNPIGVPFHEVPNDGFVPQLQGLIELYRFHYSVMKDELGEDPNLISQALQPRVTAGNVEASQETAANATDYYYDAYKYCMADTARKISCLLSKSVTYGAKVYRNIVKAEDIEGRIFTTKIQMLPTEIEQQKFELMMNEAIRANGDLVLYIDPFQLMRVAKEDVKLAETLFRQGQKKMLSTQQAIAQKNQEDTIRGQIESAKAAEEQKRMTKEMEVKGDVEKTQKLALAQNQSAVLGLVSSFLKPTESGAMPSIPAELKPLVDAVVKNVMVAAAVSTEEQIAEVQRKMQEAQQRQEQQQMQAELPAQNIQQPQPQVAA